MTTIMCKTLGFSPLAVVWSRINGNRVSLNNSVRVPTGNGNVTRVSLNLTITNASREDTGVYTCSANNDVSNVDGNVSITVQCKSML